MEIIKRTKTVEEIVGYKANDGLKIFKTQEECEKYEKSAEAAICNAFKGIMINGEEFPECYIFENFGYGSEEFIMAVLDIKNADDLLIANTYFKFYNYSGTIPNDYIGKRVLVDLGFSYDRCINPNPRTYEQLLENFEKDVKKYFQTKDEREE